MEQTRSRFENMCTCMSKNHRPPSVTLSQHVGGIIIFMKQITHWLDNRNSISHKEKKSPSSAVCLSQAGQQELEKPEET